MNFSTLFLLFSPNVYVTNFNVIIYNVRHTRNRMKYSGSVVVPLRFDFTFQLVKIKMRIWDLVFFLGAV